MKFYYTTPVETDYAQTRTDLSLGGFKSANVVPNNSPRNLFSDVSLYSIKTNRPEYIGLVLKNETGSTLTAVNLWFVYPDGCQVKYEIAAVSLNADGQMEHINTPYQAPYFAEFHEADGQINKVSLGAMEIGEAIGIWFKRSLNITNITQQYSDVNLVNNGNPIAGDEDIDIVLDYTLV